MLYGYSDASMKDGKAVATTLILSNTHFLTCFTRSYDISSSTEAEFKGLLQTMDYISRNCTDKQVVLFSDNRAAVLRCISTLSTWSVPLGTPFTHDLQDFLRMCKRFNVNIQNIRGHQLTHNPNKICDIISKVQLCGMQ